MSKIRIQHGALQMESGNEHGAAELRFLAVGDPGGSREGDRLSLIPEAENQRITFVEIHEITAETLARLAPDVVLSPLVATSFDCFDLARLLLKAGFRGRYRVAAGKLPNPGLVKREIAAAFPDLDVDLIIVDDKGKPSSG